MSYNPTDIFTQTDLKNVTKSLRVTTDIVIRGEFLKTLGEIEIISGFLGLSEASIEARAVLQVVNYLYENNEWIDIHNRDKSDKTGYQEY